MECPVCGGPAENISPEGYDGVVVRCYACTGQYEISGTVISALLQLDRAGREAALEKAKAFAAPGTRPAITTACL